MLSITRRHVCATLASALVLCSSSEGQTFDGAASLPPGRRAPPTPDLIPGQEVQKPGEPETFIADAHQGGAADGLHLLELAWGRLVDVHGLDAYGAIDPRPVFRDFVVNESVQSDGVNYLLSVSGAAPLTRLVILHRHGTPEFAARLAQAEQGLPAVVPKAENAAPPFSFVARNAVLVARFDDLLRDSQAAAQELFETVRVGILPAHLPFSARTVFDPNHGGIARGKFHSTRVLVDLTTSEFESDELPVLLPLNILGLPASPESSAASASLRIPTRTDPGSGQLALLTNLRGRGLSTTGNGPVDSSSPTLDVVRAVRAGNGEDASNGFVLDLDPPALVGAFPVAVDSASADPLGEAGFAFVVGWTFTGACGLRPLVGNVLVAGARSLEVIATGAPPTPSGQVSGARVRLVGTTPATAGELLGLGIFRAALRTSPLDRACWIRFLPEPLDPPASRIAPSSTVAVGFSEPMDPASVRPFDTLRIVRGNGSPLVDAMDIVVAEVLGSPELSTFQVTPLLPLAHVQGEATPYQVQIVAGAAGVLDLAGNPLVLGIDPIDFTLDPGAPSQWNGGIVLRFTGLDELPPFGASDLHGNVFFDLGRGLLRPRPVNFTSAPADRSNPVPGLMIPFLAGVFSPLTPLGSKLQHVWRYCDLGWNARDQTKYDLDVVGLNWAPIGGLVLADFYEEFEIRLAHSRFLPDEQLDSNLLPRYPNSGLRGAPNPFTDNILVDPLSPQAVVHPRSAGYSIHPADVFASPNGTVLMPFPLNTGSGPLSTYTWRDTAVLAKAGPNGAGLPTDVEAGAPLFLEPAAGVLARPGSVPSIGLPLLVEYRCFPDDQGIGLNRMDISLAINSSALPTFRAYSSGGINTSGLPVVVDPDLEPVPNGGFNPASNPPGQRTRSRDNAVYTGQVDFVTRLSRAHLVWIDTQVTPDYLKPSVEGDPAPGTPDARSIVVEFRGADGFSPDAGGGPFDALQLDPYGDLEVGSVQFHGGTSTWSSDVDTIDFARYVQIRLTLVNDIETGRGPELDSIGLAFTH